MPMYEFNCVSGHRFESLCKMGERTAVCPCGSSGTKRDVPSRISINARGGETLDRGERYLAALHFGQCVPDRRSQTGFRAPQTRGEVDPLLKAHGLRRGTVNQFNETLAAKYEADNIEPAIDPNHEMPRERMEETLAHIDKRREFFRRKYDAGEVPKAKDLPPDVKAVAPTPTATTGALK